MGLVELTALPVLISLTLLTCGLALALVPRRAMRTLGDGFGFRVELRSQLKALPARAAGALLAGYGLYLLVRTMDLLHALHL